MQTVYICSSVKCSQQVLLLFYWKQSNSSVIYVGLLVFHI